METVTSDTSTTEVAILIDDSVNKYHPGLQTFRLQSINGTQGNDNSIEHRQINIPNLMNKDRPNFSQAHITSVVKLELPRDVTRNFPLKFIPAGTRFLVTFNSADITKPVIVGREFS